MHRKIISILQRLLQYQSCLVRLKSLKLPGPELAGTGYPDVDYVLTTRELARMIKEAGIEFTKCDGEFEDPFGPASGAGVIFGATGGVMEAALRTVADILTGEDLESIEYHQVRGLEGIKEASVNVAGMEVKLAVAHGLGNASALLDRIKSGEAEYHFVEIMACPGGCVNGGGQPNPACKSQKLDQHPAAQSTGSLRRRQKSANQKVSQESGHHEKPL